jgi:hypothetical protein
VIAAAHFLLLSNRWPRMRINNLSGENAKRHRLIVPNR